MNEDTLFAIFSTTEAIGGTEVMQCVMEGLLTSTRPRWSTPPDVAALEVLTGFGAGGELRTRPPNAIHDASAHAAHASFRL